MLFLGVLVAMGAPLVALLRPLTGGRYAGVAFAIAVAFGVAIVVRQLRGVDDEFRTGAEHIASVLTRDVGRGAPAHVEDPSLLLGLGHVVGIRLDAGAYGIDRRLADVDLRARSGATVVAIHRAPDQQRLLPTGHESLHEGDVLAVTGTEDAVALAKEILQTGEVEASPPQPARRAEDAPARAPALD